jgi:hypothetical protein
MDPPNLLSPVHMSLESESKTLKTRPETKSSTKSKSYISCRTSTGIPRNSSVTISSESIIVFADANDLPSRNSSKHSKNEESNGGQDYHRPGLTARRYRHNSFDSISSFGFDEGIPAPLQGLIVTLQERHADQRVFNRQQISRQTSFRSLWRSRSTNKKENNLCESFPRPPSRVLLQAAGVIPEVPQHKQAVYVDKSLPPPPYHVFDTAKKKRILYMMAIVGMLTPLSTFIYFPVLGDISRVSISHMLLPLG